MQQIIQAMGANSEMQVSGQANYLRLLSCPSPVDLYLYKDGAEVGRAVQMDTGFYVKPAMGFDRFKLTTVAAQTVKIMLLDGDGGYDHFNVDLTSSLANLAIAQAVTISQVAAVSVGVAATVLLAAASARKGVRFYSEATNTADIYLGGADVTVAGGAIRVAPGATWVDDEAAPAAWYGISGTAAQSLRVQVLT